jgi:structural maintenance of chromosome 2
LKDELGPKIAKLKEERTQYMEYQRVTRELEHCKRIYIAWKYVNALNNNKKVTEDIKNINIQINENETSIENGEEKLKYIAEKIIEITNRRNTVSLLHF